MAALNVENDNTWHCVIISTSYTEPDKVDSAILKYKLCVQLDRKKQGVVFQIPSCILKFCCYTVH